MKNKRGIYKEFNRIRALILAFLICFTMLSPGMVEAEEPVSLQVQLSGEEYGTFTVTKYEGESEVPVEPEITDNEDGTSQYFYQLDAQSEYLVEVVLEEACHVSGLQGGFQERKQADNTQSYFLRTTGSQLGQIRELALTFMGPSIVAKLTGEEKGGSISVVELNSKTECAKTVGAGEIRYATETGKNYIITVTCEEGYTVQIETTETPGFVQEEGKGIYTCTTDNVNYTFEANFQKISCDVSVSLSGEKGSISYVDASGNTASGKKEDEQDKSWDWTFSYGEKLSFTITPEAGYYVETVEIDDKETTLEKGQGDSYLYEISKLTKNINIEITFGKKEIKEIKEIENLKQNGVEIKFPKTYKKIDTCENKVYYIIKKGSVTIQALDGRSICINENSVGGDKVYQKSYVINKNITISTVSLDHEDIILQLSKPICFIIDDVVPEVEVDEDTYWISNTTKELSITGKASDQYGIEKVVWATNELGAPEKDGTQATYDAKKETYRFQLSKEQGTIPEGETTYYIYAIGKVGNISKVTTMVKLDNQPPTISGISTADSVEYNETNYTYKKTIHMMVTADDIKTENEGEGVSGIETVEFEINSVTAGKKNQKVYEYQKEGSYEVPLEIGENEITVKVIDRAGNTSSKMYQIYYDAEQPVIEIKNTTGLYEAQDKYYMKESATFTVEASQKTTGIKSIEVTIYDEYDNQLQYFVEEELEYINIQLSSEMTQGRSFIYIEVEVTSNSIVERTRRYDFYIDNTIPNLSDEQIQIIDSNGNVEYLKVTEGGEYIYFGEESVTAKITVEDGKTGSGIKTITYTLKDSEGKIINTKCETITEHSTTKSIEVELKPDTKGYLYIEACDNVGNDWTVAYQTQGIILESEEAHDNSSSITIKPQGEENTHSLYAEDVTLDVTAEDTYSGISEIEWSVAIPGEEIQTESLDLLSSSLPEEIKSTTTDGNLITSALFEIPVSILDNTEKKDILVTVTLTDRVGHTKTETYTLSIDKKNPEVSVNFQGADADTEYTDIYRGERKATLKVIEQNFDAQEVEWNIITSYGSKVEISEWTHEDDVHYATVTFKTDDTYIFSMSCKDEVGREGNLDETRFVIDQTKPVIEVSMDGSAANGIYYNQNRTAVIRVTDRNFIAERMHIVGSGRQGDYELAFPKVSEWKEVADGYEAILYFTEDGMYEFYVEGKDKAGNIGERKEIEAFIIDTAKPEIEIIGVEDASANNGEVAPIVIIQDKNFHEGETHITLSGVNHGEIEVEANRMRSKEGLRIEFEDFAREQEMDDIYTLLVTQKDLAGNTASKQITFSVNRFGSVYTFGEELKQLAGNYVKEAVDVVFTETNTDPLEMDTLKLVMTRNGVPRDLIEGEDYEIEVSGGSGRWSQYTYIIDKEVFAGDGVYTVRAYSEDKAGNINQNIEENKRAEIGFGVDGTAPLIAAGNLQEGKTYKEAGYEARVSVTDNLMLSKIRVELNGEEIDYQQDGDDILFEIPESKEKQTIEIVATDAAGNEERLEVEDVLVSTNFFVRLAGNIPLLLCLIGGIVLLAGVGACATIRIRKKRING